MSGPDGKRVSARAGVRPAKGGKRATARRGEAVQGAGVEKPRRATADRSVEKVSVVKKPSARKPPAKKSAEASGTAPAKMKAAARRPRVANVAPEPAAPAAFAAPAHHTATRPARSEPPPAHGRDLGELLNEVDGAGGDEQARARAADAIGRIASRLYPEAAAEHDGEGNLLGSARQFLSTDYYLRKWGRLGMRGRSERVDDFGLDRTYESRVQPSLDALYESYFRVEVSGAERLPESGAALLVCNHGGALPWDGVMLKTAVQRNHSAGRSLRWLIEDYTFHAPFLGAFLNRIGAVRACQENAERLLSQGELLAVFPEGVKGVEKPYSKRYELQRFGRGGHVKLALRMGVPLIPVAIVGAEETYPLLRPVRAFSRAVGLPFIPITPTFPLLGPLGLLPLPSRWRIAIGPAVRDLEGLDPSVAEDTVRVNELNERVRSGVQSLLHEALEARGPNAYLNR